MGKKEITQEDLMKAKEEVNKEQNNYRHEQTKVFQSSIIKITDKVDDFDDKLTKVENNILLNNERQENMQKDMIELKDLMKEWFKEIKVELKNGYTPISEHKHNEIRIEKIEKVMYWIAGILWTWILWALLTLIFKEWLK